MIESTADMRSTNMQPGLIALSAVLAAEILIFDLLVPLDRFAQLVLTTEL